MSYDNLIKDPKSKKLTIVEIDTPLENYKWINYTSGIWYTRMTPGSGTFTDDNGNTAYWDTQNDLYYNAQSLNVDGELYTEAVDLANLEATNKSWYYDESNTDFYIHFDAFEPPWAFGRIAVGAAIGFIYGRDTTSSNYYQDIYYEDLIKSIPNLKKSKDPLFFGIIEYQGGSITFDNTSGYFDSFATRDLYGQPVRIAMGFEGLDITDFETLYTGRVEDFRHDMGEFILNVADQRKLLTRKLPINTLDTTTYPDMDSKLDGTPIPIAFGSIVRAPAYKVTDTGATETWVFCDTTYNAVGATITVTDSDGATVAHAGTVTDGTFTSTSTKNKLYVTFNVPTVTNGLDIITDILENYEGVTYNSSNYDTDEWTAASTSVANSGIWIGKGNLMTAADVIERVCVDNNGLFEVLGDGRYTFRLYDSTRLLGKEIYQDELLADAYIDYESEEYLTSVKIKYNEDIGDKEPEIYTDDSKEAEIYGRYRQYKEQEFETTLTSSTDAATLSGRILERSDYIYPKVALVTKMQNSDLRIMDLIAFTAQRQDGTIIIPRSSYEVIGVDLNLTGYECAIELRQVAEIGTQQVPTVFEWDSDPFYIIEWAATPDMIVEA